MQLVCRMQQLLVFWIPEDFCPMLGKQDFSHIFRKHQVLLCIFWTAGVVFVVRCWHFVSHIGLIFTRSVPQPDTIIELPSFKERRDAIDHQLWITVGWTIEIRPTLINDFFCGVFKRCCIEHVCSFLPIGIANFIYPENSTLTQNKTAWPSGQAVLFCMLVLIQTSLAPETLHTWPGLLFAIWLLCWHRLWRA